MAWFGKISVAHILAFAVLLSGNNLVLGQNAAQQNLSKSAAAGQASHVPLQRTTFSIDCVLLRQLQSPLFAKHCSGNPQTDPQVPSDPGSVPQPGSDPIDPEDSAGLPPPPNGEDPGTPPIDPPVSGTPSSGPVVTQDGGQPQPVTPTQPAPGNQPVQPLPPGQAAPALTVPGAPRVNAEVVVLIGQAPPQNAAGGIAQDYNITLVESTAIGLIDTTVARYRIPDNRTIEAVLATLLADARVGAAQPNYLYSLQDDTRAGKAAALQYALGKLSIPAAHQHATGDGVTIALIDSGVDVSHPELSGARIEIKNAVTDIPFAAEKHGTALAGVLVAQEKLLGVAPGSRLLAVRAFYRGASGSQETTSLILAQALDWSVSQGARVVNMSFAGPEDPLFGEVIDAAAKKGTFLVAAAGNEGEKAPKAHPAAHERVAAVTATDSQNLIYDQANRGDHIDVAAPGVDILVPAAGSGYEMISGTSLSAAYISGIYALMLEKSGGSAENNPIEILKNTAQDLGLPGFDPAFGAGMADAAKAVQNAGRQ